MRTVRSMEVDVSELEDGVVQREVPLVGAPANTTFEAQTVLVTLRVQPKMKERVLSPLRVDAEGVVPRALRPRAITARLRGPEAILDQLNPASVLAIVNLSDAAGKKGCGGGAGGASRAARRGRSARARAAAVRASVSVASVAAR